MTDETFPKDRGSSDSETQQQFGNHAWKEAKSDFEAEFLELLNSKSSEGRLIFAFIRARLKQFHLEEVSSEAFVLNEVYLRAIARIRDGAVIRIPQAWIRATAYNYIRELSRERRKSDQLEDYHQGNQVEEEKQGLSWLGKNEELKSERTLVQMAFRMLDPKERQLLHLKIVEGLSWREIRCQSEYKNLTLAALRKRKQRALEKLHRHYRALKGSPDET